MEKQFDTAKGAFYLVCLIIVTQMIVSLGITFFCMVSIADKVIAMGSCKDVSDKMMELFQMSFTAAIAFAGGRMSAPSVPAPKLPEKQRENE